MTRARKLPHPGALIVACALSLAVVASEDTSTSPGDSYIQFGDHRVYIKAVEPQATINPHSVYKQLEQTCTFWTRRYKASVTELARVNMNVACRDAAEFARSELNREIRPNFAAAKPRPAARGGGAVLLNAGTVNAGSETASAKCQRLLKQKKSINAKLRKGYRSEQGNRLRERRREIKKRLHEHC